MRAWIFISPKKGKFVQERTVLKLILNTSPLCVDETGLGVKKASLCKNRFLSPKSSLSKHFLNPASLALLWFLNTKAGSKPSLFAQEA